MKNALIGISMMLLLGLLRVGWAAMGGSENGEVLDYDTGKPIAGAILLGRWMGNTFALVESYSVCIHTGQEIITRLEVPPCK